jgi:acetyltransferase
MLQSNKCNSQFVIEPDAIQYLKAYGINYEKNWFIKEKGDLEKLKTQFEFPIVMKIVSPDIVHKSDVGGVIVNINNINEANKAYDKIMNNVSQNKSSVIICGVLVCKQADPGIEVIVGCTKDDVFGKVIMFGFGGLYVEILKDVVYHTCPLSEEEAFSMLKHTNTYNILSGARGQAIYDLRSLVRLISKISELYFSNDDISEIELNPIRIYEDKIVVLDVRIIKEVR